MMCVSPWGKITMSPTSRVMRSPSSKRADALPSLRREPMEVRSVPGGRHQVGRLAPGAVHHLSLAHEKGERLHVCWTARRITLNAGDIVIFPQRGDAHIHQKREHQPRVWIWQRDWLGSFPEGLKLSPSGWRRRSHEISCCGYWRASPV